MALCVYQYLHDTKKDTIDALVSVHIDRLTDHSVQAMSSIFSESADKNQFNRFLKQCEVM